MKVALNSQKVETNMQRGNVASREAMAMHQKRGNNMVWHQQVSAEGNGWGEWMPQKVTAR